MWRHLDELRVKLAEDGHEIFLSRHDFMYVFVNHRHFIEAGPKISRTRPRLFPRLPLWRQQREVSSCVKTVDLSM